MSIYTQLVIYKNRIKRKLYPYLPLSLRYRQANKKNVLVFSSRRGGSTLLAQVITGDGPFRYVDQPFDMTELGIRKALVKAHLPAKQLSQFISLKPEEEKVVTAYINKLLSGEIPEFGKFSNWPASRTVLKICNALPLIEWMHGSFDVSSVYLYRHPVPQALSVLKNKWVLTNEAFKEDTRFMQQLTAEQQQKVDEIIQSGSLEEKAVLNWVLENYIPLCSTDRSIIKISYEELVLGYKNIIKYLCQELELKEHPNMYAFMAKPSASYQYSDAKTKEAIGSGDKHYLLSKWMTSENREIIRVCDELLSLFEIKEYTADHYLPRKEYFIFPEVYA